MPVRFCFISIQPSNWAPNFSARPAASSLCSPLPVNPCASVSGSKIFTFPPPDFTPPHSRRPPLFAPRSPLGLVPPFRGAKSSHSRRRILTSCAPGGLLSLLPDPREPLCLRFGEQNLHIPATGFRPSPAPAAHRKWPKTWCKGNGRTRLCSGSCTKSPPTARRKWPKTWCKGNGRSRLCSGSCTKSLPSGGSSPAGAQPHPPDRPTAPLPTHAKKAPGSAIAARCFSLSSFSIIPIPLLPAAQS